MTEAVPEDRMPVRHRALFLVVVGAFGIVAGLGMLAGTFGELDKGWVGAIPAPIQQVAAVVLVVSGAAFTFLGLLWMLVPLRGPRAPVVHFEPNRLVIRGPVLPRIAVVERDTIVKVTVTNPPAWGRVVGLSPMAVDLARDIARWADVPPVRPRQALHVDDDARADTPRDVARRDRRG